MKKLLAILLSCTAMAAAMTGCSDDNSDSSVESEGSQVTTDADEADLGEYTYSELGTKLYYDSEDIPDELMAALEKYFISFSQHDYDSYAECLYSEYITEMNEFLEADYGYDLETSFENQCSSLETNAGGEFTVTRIKAELPEEDGSEDYLTSLGEIFETDFYETVKNGCDAIHDVTFYVMAEADCEETLLISEFEIVFAEKDGAFYTFG
ncbi:MAG: hypothetical protein LUD57_05820 [Ruminococcus sp.]|nr:hypothetical protein [Ruminococcus sp.]